MRCIIAHPVTLLNHISIARFDFTSLRRDQSGVLQQVAKGKRNSVHGVCLSIPLNDQVPGETSVRNTTLQSLGGESLAKHDSIG